MEADYSAAIEGRRIRLPALIRHYRWWIAYAVPWAPFIAVYQAINRNPIVEPRELPFSLFDRLVPFIPELLPLYVAYIPFFWWTVSRSEDDEQANRILYATYLQLLISLPFFAFFPVRMPRELFYTIETFNWADTFWRWFDAPHNCFPSLHASNCMMLMQFNWSRPHRWLFTFMGAAIIASTVLVKQHYVIDVLGGAIVYVVARTVMKRVEIVWPSSVHRTQ